MIAFICFGTLDTASDSEYTDIIKKMRNRKMKITLTREIEVTQCMFCEEPASPFRPEDDGKFELCEECREECDRIFAASVKIDAA